VTDAKELRTRLEVNSPLYTRYLRGKPATEGATMRLIGMSSNSDDYRTYSSGGGGSLGGGVCPYTDDGYRTGVATDNQGWSIGVAPHKTVTMTMRFEIIGDAPWLNTSYAPSVTLFPPLHRKHSFPGGWEGYKVPAGAVAPPKKIVLRPPNPVIALPLAGRVDFRIDGKKRALPARRPVPMSGQLVPPLAGQPINISVARTSYFQGPRPTDVIAQVFTDTAGNFAYSGWRPKKGRYLINAAYPGQAGSNLAPDEGCALGLSVYGK